MIDALAERRHGILAVLVVATWLIGAWGFSRYENLTSNDALNNFYQALQLFWVGFWHGPSDVAVPWQLQVTRWLAPVLTATTLVSAFTSVVRQAVRGAERHSASGMVGHTVVIGLGAKGRSTAVSLLEVGDAVAVVERDENTPSSTYIRSLGIPVIDGDGTKREILQCAGVGSAKRVLVVSGSDVTNVRIALAAKALAEESRPASMKPLVIAAHISDVGLAQPVQESCNATSEICRIEFISDRVSGVARMLNDVPVPETNHAACVVGTGETAAEFIAQATVRHQLISPKAGTLCLHVVGVQANDFVRQIAIRFPGIEQLTLLTPHEVQSVGRLGPSWIEAIREAVAATDLRALYVVGENDDESARVALMCATTTKPHVKIAVALKEPAEYESVLSTRFLVHDPLGVLLDPEIALEGTSELLARAIHAFYISTNSARGTGSHLAARQWRHLTEAEMEANRDPARDMPRKLAAVGMRTVPISKWNSSLTTFTHEERQRLALLEHERWLRYATKRGYTWGEMRSDDPERMTHPDLVSWEDLTAEARKKDFDTIDNIPLLYAMIGYRLDRMQSEEPAVERIVSA